MRDKTIKNSRIFLLPINDWYYLKQPYYHLDDFEPLEHLYYIWYKYHDHLSRINGITVKYDIDENKGQYHHIK